MAVFGYARVSTDGRSQKVSGATTERPELAKVLRRLQDGDVLIVTRLDRLARSTRDLLNILDAIGKAGPAQVAG